MKKTWNNLSKLQRKEKSKAIKEEIAMGNKECPI